jgi:hypothetical protein
MTAITRLQMRGDTPDVRKKWDDIANTMDKTELMNSRESAEI